MDSTILRAPSRATAVLSTWNKCTDVLANLEGLVAQTLPFERIVVVDNASSALYAAFRTCVAWEGWAG